MKVRGGGGALDCRGSQTGVKSKDHFSWLNLIGGVVLESVTNIMIADGIERMENEEDDAFLEGSSASVVCEKKGSLYNEEWRPHASNILTDKKNSLLRMASLMHQQRMKMRNPNQSIMKKETEFDWDDPLGRLLYWWNKYFTTDMNLFPIKFDSDFHASVIAIAEKFWKSLGETGLFLAPAALRHLEMNQLIDRLKVLVADPRKRDRLVEIVNGLKLQFEGGGGSSLADADHCWQLVKQGFSMRLEQVEQRASWDSVSAVPQFFKSLRESVNSIEMGDIVVTSGDTICAHLQDAVKSVLKKQIEHESWDTFMWHLNVHDIPPYLLVPVLEEIMNLRDKSATTTESDHLRKYTKYNPVSMRDRLMAIYFSIEECHSGGMEVQTPAENLQVQLLYPDIVFEDFHY